ncbi:MAG: hypothetical protein [Olavius algarvensis spirochete endosymbiont]|nr:MAG: hypothetical protein [Olavius algarvensis spirochete endosymbiont]
MRKKILSPPRGKITHSHKRYSLRRFFISNQPPLHNQKGIDSL